MGFCTNVIQCTFTTTTQNTKITFRSEPVCVWTKAALVKFFNATLSGFLSHLRFALKLSKLSTFSFGWNCFDD